MNTPRLSFATAAAILLLSALSRVAVEGSALPIAEGPFQPTMESLTHYQCPGWFRDAKFGIWAHWGPQAVPMMGDWFYIGSSGR
jgi:alpha-L-fucosidase